MKPGPWSSHLTVHTLRPATCNRLPATNNQQPEDAHAGLVRASPLTTDPISGLSLSSQAYAVVSLFRSQELGSRREKKRKKKKQGKENEKKREKDKKKEDKKKRREQSGAKFHIFIYS